MALSTALINRHFSQAFFGFATLYFFHRLGKRHVGMLIGNKMDHLCCLETYLFYTFSLFCHTPWPSWNIQVSSWWFAPLSKDQVTITWFTSTRGVYQSWPGVVAQPAWVTLLSQRHSTLSSGLMTACFNQGINLRLASCVRTYTDSCIWVREGEIVPKLAVRWQCRLYTELDTLVRHFSLCYYLLFPSAMQMASRNA